MRWTNGISPSPLTSCMRRMPSENTTDVTADSKINAQCTLISVNVKSPAELSERPMSSMLINLQATEREGEGARMMKGGNRQ